MECEGKDWIQLAKGKFQWRDFGHTVMKLQIPQGEILKSWVSCSFSPRSHMHSVRLSVLRNDRLPVLKTSQTSSLIAKFRRPGLMSKKLVDHYELWVSVWHMADWQKIGLGTALCIQNILNTSQELSSRECGIILTGTKTSRLLRNLDNGWQCWNVHFDHWVGPKGGVIMMKNGRITCRPWIPTRSLTSEAVSPQPDLFSLHSLRSWMVVVVMFAKPIIGG